MNKNTSIILIAAVAGIMVAGALAVTMTTSSVYATRNGAGGAGDSGGNGNSQGTNGASVNGGTHTDNGNHFGQDT